MYAQVFAGVDHFFFLAAAESDLDSELLSWTTTTSSSTRSSAGSYEITRLPLAALLGYDVRPWALARRLVGAR